MSDVAIEGSGASQFVRMLQHFGSAAGTKIELGTVTVAAPSLQVRIDNMSIDLEPDDLIVAAHLTKHKRRIRVDGGAEQEYEFMDELAVGDRVIVASADNGQNYYVIDRAVVY